MSSLSKSRVSNNNSDEADAPDDHHELRRGPWTLEEDTLLVHCIASHGEGRWNLLAKRAGLRRTGKSCRLRWLNYLKPDVKRGNLTPQEQLLILDLHSKLGNRWSKIAQHLPGRTDNEIKNYWRTRVQKQARHLKIDANSTAFQEIVRCFWIPRLLQKIEGSTSSPSCSCSSSFSSSSSAAVLSQNSAVSQPVDCSHVHNLPLTPPSLPPLPRQEISGQGKLIEIHNLEGRPEHNSDSEQGSTSCISSSTESMNISQISQLSEYQQTSPFQGMSHDANSNYSNYVKDCYYVDSSGCNMETANLATLSLSGGFQNPAGDWVGCDFGDNYMWSVDELMAL